MAACSTRFPPKPSAGPDAGSHQHRQRQQQPPTDRLIAQSHLAALGVKSRITYNAERTKANLFATLGEGKPAGVIVSGHTDTVPWDGQDWSVDPLSAVVQNEKLYGRGSADMKSFIAIALANAHRFLESDSPFAVHFAFSYEEEIGCFGVKELIADMRDAGIKPLACIVGEPTSMVPAIAHKGVYRYKCCVRGKEAHSSLTPKSVNAIEMAARVIGKVRDMAEDFERNEPRYEGFDVPFSTASVGQFHGGIADNVVPRDAEFRYEFRDLPTADAKRMQADVVAYAGGAGAVDEEGGARTPASSSRPSARSPASWAPPGRPHHPAGPAPGQRGPHHAGGLRHRSGPVQERRHPHRGVRPRQHRAGAPARRVREPGAAGALRAVHGAAGHLSKNWLRPAEIGCSATATTAARCNA
jgi:acetylornithine deacetylase/succinyl-diaminopimelate desuccinylase-like protein